MSDTAGDLAAVVSDEDKTRAGLLHDLVHRGKHGLSSGLVQTLAGLVENEQAWRLHHCSGKEYQALVTEREGA